MQLIFILECFCKREVYDNDFGQDVISSEIIPIDQSFHTAASAWSFVASFVPLFQWTEGGLGVSFVTLSRRFASANDSYYVSIGSRCIVEYSYSADQECTRRVLANGVAGWGASALVHIDDVFRANVGAGRVYPAPFRVLPTQYTGPIFCHFSYPYYWFQDFYRECLVREMWYRRVKDIPIVKANFFVIFMPFASHSINAWAG